MQFNPNVIWMYLLYAFVAVFVIIESLVYLIKSLKRAKEINMDMSKIKKVISSSIIFSILPSVGIFIGIVTLSYALGIPFPAIRLSIVGSLQYETMAADWVSGQFGFREGLKGLIQNNLIDGKTFVTFSFAMTFGIIWGALFCTLFYKKLQPKMQALGKKSKNGNDTIFASIFIGMVVAYISVAFSSVVNDFRDITRYYAIIAIIISAGSMWLFDTLIVKYKQQWLENFSLAFSMILGMTVVGILNALI